MDTIARFASFSQGCSAKKRCGNAAPPHYTPDLGWSRTLNTKYCSDALTCKELL